MNRAIETYSLSDGEVESIKLKMLNWANRFSISVFLDNNNYNNHLYHQYECLLAVDPLSYIESEGNEDYLKNINDWHHANRDWLFGHICYDYKNSIFDKLFSGKPAQYKFPLISFFCPKTVCYISADKRTLIIETMGASPKDIHEAIHNENIPVDIELPKVNFKKRLDHASYLDIVNSLKTHIKNGDCYEINFCNEGYAEDVIVDPSTVFKKLNQQAPAPFAAFYKYKDQYLMCSSPERYLCKVEEKIISQPIKGTIKRDGDKDIDEGLKHQLFTSAKDRAENIMIVDLTRNDLSHSCKIGTVEVEELYGIYSYPRVHQMISTVTGVLKETTKLMDAIYYSFPMGSMTGAPKYKVMQLIEHYEPTSRELFSGSIGYITPDGNFDFNVIIRSLFYNGSTRYLSYQTGGAITYDSIAEQEWEETLLKASSLEHLFKS